MLSPNNTIFTLIDVQTRLCAVMHEREKLIDNLVKLLKGLQLLQIPIIWLEQNPEKMGSTIPELSQLLQQQTPITKMTFSCCGSTDYLATLKTSGRTHVIIAGIETHVCVYQTAMDLLRLNHPVEVVSDATSSRTPNNKTTALARISSQTNTPTHTSLTTTEMLLFELMQTADHPAFRDMLKIVK